MSMFSTASSVVNPSSVRGIVHRLWNAFDNRYMKGLFGGQPHDNNILDPQYPVHTSALHTGSVVSAGGPATGTGGPGVDGSSSMPSPLRRPLSGGVGHPNNPAHLFSLNSSSFGSVGEETKGGGGDIGASGVSFATEGGGGGGTGGHISAGGVNGDNSSPVTAPSAAAAITSGAVGGGAGAVPPMSVPSGGQPI